MGLLNHNKSHITSKLNREASVLGEIDLSTLKSPVNRHSSRESTNATYSIMERSSAHHKYQSYNGTDSRNKDKLVFITEFDPKKNSLPRFKGDGQ